MQYGRRYDGRFIYRTGYMLERVLLVIPTAEVENPEATVGMSSTEKII